MTLPVGRVAFLFTDIEGSTRLIQRMGAAYPSILESHAAILRAACTRHGGVEVNSMGDGFFLAFGRPQDGLQTAVEGQCALATHGWPPGASVRVRMGMHVGEAAIGPDGYVGMDVHRAARISDAAHGGQILLSATAWKAVQGGDAAVTAIDLGEHALKDLQESERLYQIAAPGIAAEFPPVRAKGAPRHNLPAEVTRLIGRAEDVGRLGSALSESRLLTIIGPGGVGKTRLALRVAANALARFEGGVWWVPLAQLRSAEDVPQAVAAALHLTTDTCEPVRDRVAAYLADRRLLLTLDNFEHVSEAAGWLSNLLERAPGLSILVTSRSRLRIAGERVHWVVTLPPPAEELTDVDVLSSVPAVALFVDRVRAVDADFRLTPENAAAVASVVRRLDGLPLAIELAAARSQLFSPSEMLSRLDQRLKTLKGGAVDMPERHRALRATISWSYDLLPESTRTLFRRISVFAGGFTTGAAEFVCQGDVVEDALDDLQVLMDHSLLRSPNQQSEGRFGMLETIREFAHEALDASDQTQATEDRHVAWVRWLAEEAEPHLTRSSHAATIGALSAEQDNLRAALRRCAETGDASSTVAIAAATWRFWHATGQLNECRRWLEAVVGHPSLTTPEKARALSALGGVAYWQESYADAIARYRHARSLHTEVGDALAEADDVLALSTATIWSGDPAAGAALADESLKRFEALGARDRVGMALMAQGFARWSAGDPAGARPLWQQSRAIAIEVGDPVEAAVKRLAIAAIDVACGDRSAAIDGAARALEELVTIKNISFIIMAIDWIAALTAQARPADAMRLAAAAGNLRRRFGGGLTPEKSGLEPADKVARRLLGPAELESARAQEMELSLDDAVESARLLTASALLAAVD